MDMHPWLKYSAGSDWKKKLNGYKEGFFRPLSIAFNDSLKDGVIQKEEPLKSPSGNEISSMNL